MFENEGLKRLDSFDSDRLLAIIVEGRRIELTQLFSREDIITHFPYLDKSSVHKEPHHASPPSSR